MILSIEGTKIISPTPGSITLVLDTDGSINPDFDLLKILSSFEFKKGIDYPNPIVNLEETRRFASDTLWNLKNDVIVFNENQRILKKHTFGKRINS